MKKYTLEITEQELNVIGSAVAFQGAIHTVTDVSILTTVIENDRQCLMVLGKTDDYLKDCQSVTEKIQALTKEYEK